MTETHSCPHCGQDLRLPPDALARLEAAEQREAVLEERLSLAPVLDVAFMDYQTWREKTVAALALKETPHE